jgi:hypothetical protein
MGHTNHLLTAIKETSRSVCSSQHPQLDRSQHCTSTAKLERQVAANQLWISEQMTDLPRLKFAAIGLDHPHIYDQVQGLLNIGAECVGFWTSDDATALKGFIERFALVPRVDDKRQLLDEPSVH